MSSTRHAARPSALGRLRLAAQLALLGGGLVAIVVAGSFALLERRLHREARDRFAIELGRTQGTLLGLQRRERRQLLWAASLVGEAPALRAAVETERAERAGPSAAAARATVQRAVEEQLDGVDADLVVVTDVDGRVVASAARQAARPAPDESLAAVPAVRHALDPQAAVDSANLGVVRLGDDWFTAAAAPILVDGYTTGTIILAERIDQDRVDALTRTFDGAIVATAGTRVLGTTLPADAARQLAATVPGDSARTLHLAGDDWVAAALPLGVAQTGEPVTVWMLHSVGRSVGALTGALARDFLLVGLVAVLLAVGGAALVARAVLAPLQRIVALLREGARTGTFARAPEAPGAPVELRWLGESYGALADALDAERDAVRRRTAELEAANADLTQQVRERVRVEGVLHEREAQLRQAQKLEALGTLAGGVAHDFNNLLTVISGFTELALQQVPDERPRRDLAQVRDAAHRAGELTAQLLAFGRKQVLRPRVMDLNDSVARIEAMLGRVLGAHVALRVETAGDLARVHADPGQLEQVLMNLAINARDAMPDGGTLTITTRNVPDGVALVVRDSGTGMDAATQARIFEPFFTTKEQGKGTGLGLATVYGIVQQSGGTIAVESAPAQGTTFTIVLPAVHAALDAVAADDAAIPRGVEVVLLVEDEAPVRELAARVLAELGYHVLVAADGTEALAVAEQFPNVVDVLLTDVVMPRMTGRELARRLQEQRAETRVLFMSGHSEDAVALHGDLGARGTHFMRKPFTAESLAHAVRECLDAEVSTAVG